MDKEQIKKLWAEMIEEDKKRIEEQKRRLASGNYVKKGDK